jgi:hypothetical protein
MTQLLTIAGGVMAVYILLALITSHMCEWVSALTNQRGHLLERAIVVLLGGVHRDPTRDTATKELVDHLYDHPLMGNLGATNARLPSYIPARAFSISLIASLRRYTAAIASKPDAPVVAAPTPPAFSAPDVLLDDLKGSVTGLPDGRLKSTLVTVLQGTKNDYDSALKAIDTWFDAQMDRVGGAYKRWSGIVQAIIALVVVAALNSDSLTILAQLHNASNATAAINAANSATGQNVGALVNGLTTAGVTVGWPNVPQDAGAWLMKIAGLLITWFAVLMGAPFWFDLLKQIVPVRLAGAKPVTTNDEASGDKQAKNVAPEETSS